MQSLSHTNFFKHQTWFIDCFFTLDLLSGCYSLRFYRCRDNQSSLGGNTCARSPEYDLLLQVEKGLLQEEARYAQKENQELRQETQLLRLRNTELEDKVPPLHRGFCELS